MSGSAATSTEEFIELLSAEQYVDLQKMRDYARHGVQSAVRGEVWLYLLGVLSDDKSQEMTSVRSKYMEYDSLDKHSAMYEKRIRNEASRYYQRRLIPRPPPGRKLGRPVDRISLRGMQAMRSHHDEDAVKDAQGSINSNQYARNGKEGVLGKHINAQSRGLNRVDDGQQSVLAGVMGGNPAFGSSSESSLQSNDDKVQLDPEAASANEMKRFCLAVEDIVCAHLNRWKWRSAEGASGILSTSPSQSRADAGNKSPDDTSDNGARDAGDASQQPIDRIAQPIASLPREYDWAHEPTGTPRGINSPASMPASASLDRQAANSGVAPNLELCQMYKPEYHPDLIILCAPFVMCIRSEAGMYFAFERLMSLVEQYNTRNPLPARIATFLTLFRTTLPELYAYFDEEEVDVIGFVSAWLRHLLAAEMRIENVMRLWDTYFAVPDPLDLHLYVCLAILTNYKDALEELDQSEAKSMLFSLPLLDVDRIINEAINIRLAHRQAEIRRAKEELVADDDEDGVYDDDGDQVAEVQDTKSGRIIDADGDGDG